MKSSSPILIASGALLILLATSFAVADHLLQLTTAEPDEFFKMILALCTVGFLAIIGGFATRPPKISKPLCDSP